MNHVSEQVHVIPTLCQQVVRIALIKKPCNYQDHLVRDRHSTRFRPINNIATITKRKNIRVYIVKKDQCTKTEVI